METKYKRDTSKGVW